MDVSGLVALREKIKDEFAEREGVRLTYLPFIVRATVEGLKEYPVLNSAWDEDRIVLRKRINLGIAVDLEDALIVPVIPDADELNTLGLARKMEDLVRRTREGKLTPDDTAGGTFTVNNPGSLGSVVSTPIINHPQGGHTLRRSHREAPGRRGRHHWRRHRHPEHDEPGGLIRPPHPRRRNGSKVFERRQTEVGSLYVRERSGIGLTGSTAVEGIF